MAHERAPRPDDIVVTGTGVVSRLGLEPRDLIGALRTGESPPFTIWDEATTIGCGCDVVGMVQHEITNDMIEVDRKSARFLGRSARIALYAARTALREAGIGADNLAVIVGSGTGDVQTHREIEAALVKGSTRGVGPTVIPRLMASTVSANLVNVLRATGPSMSAAAACAGGAWNTLIAAQVVRDGFADAAIAGGVEILDLHFHAGFDAMRAYNRTANQELERASRPYAADRAGFIFGEGAGIMVLERRDRAEARNQPILGTLLGWGMSSDGQGEMVAPFEGGAAKAMRAALRYADIDPADVDYINTHGTSTPVGDVTEVKALRSVFGEHRPAYGSTKGYTAHTVSAAGAIEAIATLAMLREGFLAPSVNASPLDPELEDWPPVREVTPRPLAVALSNSFGFGGTNVTLALGR
ncbi:MAG: beta-ketoacyl-[acyl-carrier-protein] synthase family protein [Myxococcota bacterium]